MQFAKAGVIAGAILVFSTTKPLQAQPDTWGGFYGGQTFKRIATLPNYRNLTDIGDETVSEIVAATKNGRVLIYTDAETESIGLVSIGNPRFPYPLGLVDVGGEPTSVDVLGNRYALVAVNTSESLIDPSGHLAVVNIWTKDIVAEIDVGGQPDALKISPDGRYAAVAIENERDEDIFVDGVEGGLPQTPSGSLIIVDISADGPSSWGVRSVDLTGLATYGPEDPEPEFVDINHDNHAVVSLQENNHVAIVDLRDGSLIGDFDAGVVDLEAVDTVEEDIIALSGSLKAVPREPDAITWVPGRTGYRIGTANEGDLFGGSRGFTLFNIDGSVDFDSGNTFEHIAVRHGHYPEARSENKGSEPEAIEYGRYRNGQYLFVASERGSFVAVYKLGRFGRPRFLQILPAPLGPEGVLAIPSRDLLVVSGEVDDPTYGVRSSIMIYRLSGGRAAYPEIFSQDDERGLPIPWSALSGMTALPGSGSKLLAVWDSFYDESNIFSIDASRSPARITATTTIAGGAGNFDPEGITVAPDGTYWIASEGNAGGSRPNRILQVDPNGTLMREIELPAEISACRSLSTATATLGSGFEGIAAIPAGDEGYALLVAQQRGWDYTTPECEALDDDDGGLNANGQPKRSRIWKFDPVADVWTGIGWELAPVPENAAWVGLSEITLAPNGELVLIERDNRSGDWTELKTLVTVSMDALSDGLVTADEKHIRDLIPAMERSRGWISDKPEGVAITDQGDVFVVTDNDGVDDWSGETSFLRIRTNRYRGRTVR